MTRHFPFRKLASVRVTAPLFLLLALFLVSACTPSHPQSTFDAAGPVAADQRFLFLFIFWVAVAVFVVVEGALIYTVIRYRRRRGQGMPEQVHGNRPLEIGWTIAPAIVLVVIAVPTIMVLLETQITPPECENGDTDKCINVEVIGHQWWWEFRYPDNGGLITANELHMPAGKKVNFLLDSADVLHSFWVPKLGGKTDVFPAGGNQMWLEGSEAGTFQGQCAELCGISHANMRFMVIVHPTQEIPCVAGRHQPPLVEVSTPALQNGCPANTFEEWVEEQHQNAVAPETEGAKRGEALFLSKGCVACHTIRGNPVAAGKIGPDLTHFGSRATLGAGMLANNAQNLERWLTDPDDVKPGNIMTRDAPVYTGELEPLDLADIVELSAYLGSLQ
jgi:cytochrome c oxidase subunit 2